MRSFKVLSALLGYPSEELMRAAPELRRALDAEALVRGAERRALDALIAEIEGGDIYDLQERYVLLFDRTRSLSLHLFEHVHGESRDRGQAMVDLGALYERHGLALAAHELPDHLPLFLEFLSTRPFAEAQELLGDAVHVLAALAERLRRRKTAYEAVPRALVALSRARPNPRDLAAVLAEPDPEPDDLAALDAEWEAAPVQFGGAADPAAEIDGRGARIRAALRPAPGVAPPVPRGPSTVFTRHGASIEGRRP